MTLTRKVVAKYSKKNPVKGLNQRGVLIWQRTKKLKKRWNLSENKNVKQLYVDLKHPLSEPSTDWENCFFLFENFLGKRNYIPDKFCGVVEQMRCETILYVKKKQCPLATFLQKIFVFFFLTVVIL